MVPTNSAVSGRRRVSKAYLSLSGVSEPHSGNLTNQAAPVTPCPFDRTSPTIGSLPINALAIALALATGFSDPDRGLD
jgi:hypothetical protein